MDSRRRLGSKQDEGKTGFMDLPGGDRELRNQVYASIKVAEKENLSRKKDSVGYRSYFHLCHVNYQVRQEVRILFLREFTHDVPFPDLSVYVNTFLLPYGTFEWGRGMRRIRIKFEVAGNDVRARVNVAPLMRMFNGKNSLVVAHEFLYQYFEWEGRKKYNLSFDLQAQMAGLGFGTYRLQSDPVPVPWREYVTSAVEELWITKSRWSSFKVGVVVKPEFAEPWMKDTSRINYSPTLRAQELYAWVNRVGYPGLWKNGVWKRGMLSVKVASKA